MSVTTTTKTTDYQGPLAGLNVIDFGHYYAGPMAGMLLADQGANVVRIVRPGDKEIAPQQYRLLNRNKKLIELDLKTETGKNQALLLIEKADVVIENFRPGVMQRLGLDYAILKPNNPRLVYLSLPGFASNDKQRAHIQAWEGVLGAAGGVYADTSAFRDYLGFPPLYTWVPQNSMYGAMNGAIAVMSALVAREHHHCGTVIEVPLADSTWLGFAIQFVYKLPFYSFRAQSEPNTALPESLKPLVYSSGDSPAELAEKIEQARGGTMRDAGLDNRTYTCGDGRQLSIWSNSFQKFTQSFVKVLGIDKQLEREGFVVAGYWEPGLNNNISDPNNLTSEGKQRLTQVISETLLTKTAEEWEQQLTAAQVPAAVIRTRDEWLALEPLLKSGVHTKMGDGQSQVTVPGRLADISGPDDALMNGYQEAEVIEVAGVGKLFEANNKSAKAAETPVSPLKKADLLHGLKVLDLSNVAAGPVSGYTLAQFGADVIKADPPEYPNPGLAAATVFTSLGKRSILTDVTTAPGREILERLIAWADVVLHNSLDDTAQRLGVSHAQLKDINPNIVSCQPMAEVIEMVGKDEPRLTVCCKVLVV